MKDVLTTFQAARICGADISSIINWIKSGRLKAYKTPGGHRRIRRADLLDMIARFNLPVPRGFSRSAVSVLLIGPVSGEERRRMARLLGEIVPGAEICTADNAFAAGKSASEKRPSLLIVDLDMPGIPWPGICRTIRGDRRLRSSALLCMASVVTKRLLSSAVKHGADGCIGKPAVASELSAVIKKILPA